ncbi:MAG TPA: hypothetical protein PLX84_13740, partial [Acidiphilium sp.]|nr:hypothetical protein [Acidiphilium sp.]
MKELKTALPPSFNIDRERERLTAAALAKQHAAANAFAQERREFPLPFDEHGRYVWPDVAARAADDYRKHCETERPSGWFSDKQGQAWDAQKENLRKLAIVWKADAERVQPSASIGSMAHRGIENDLANLTEQAIKNHPDRSKIDARVEELEKYQG